MDFKFYQDEAQKTEQLAIADPEIGILITLMGLSGETGSLLSAFKKRARDGVAHERFLAVAAEELGDILWYVSAVCSKLNLDFAEVAMSNLAKIQERWPSLEGVAAPSGPLYSLLDELYPTHEQISRRFLLHVVESRHAGRPVIHMVHADLKTRCGDSLRDNAYADDGYRFHDAFHLAYAAVLGWSPVVRSLMKCKRKSNPLVDEVEDGGRAVVIEEGIAAFVYDYARRHSFLQGVDSLDSELLKTIKSLTSNLEVANRSVYDWEKAIKDGYQVWREVAAHRGGTIKVDLLSRTVAYVPLPDCVRDEILSEIAKG